MVMGRGLTDAPAIPMLAENNLDEGRRFWRDTMGLPEVYYDEKYRESAYRSGSTVFGIYEHQGGSRCTHTQLAFQVDDVASTVQELRQLGLRFEEYDLPYLRTVNGIADMGDQGEQGAWFKDPGGNIIGLFTASGRLMRAMQTMPQMAGVGAGVGSTGMGGMGGGMGGGGMGGPGGGPGPMPGTGMP